MWQQLHEKLLLLAELSFVTACCLLLLWSIFRAAYIRTRQDLKVFENGGQQAVVRQLKKRKRSYRFSADFFWKGAQYLIIVACVAAIGAFLARIW